MRMAYSSYFDVRKQQKYLKSNLIFKKIATENFKGVNSAFNTYYVYPVQ